MFRASRSCLVFDRHALCRAFSRARAKTGNSIDAKIAIARPLGLAELEGRALPVRLRDGLARLLSPYL